MSTTPVTHEPLDALIARTQDSEAALIALGIPRCPACMLLPPALTAIARARPGLDVGIALLAGPEDWELRTTLLWPRGIHVSRSAVPVLVLLRGGVPVGSRPGGAPAHVLDAWLTEHLGPPLHPLPGGRLPEEESALADLAPRRGQHLEVRGRGPLGDAFGL